MKSQGRRLVILVCLSVVLMLVTMVNSSEIHQEMSTNHKDSVVLPSASSLKMEARGDSVNDVIEGKSKISNILSTGVDKSGRQPIILGTSKVAIVYSERKPLSSDKEKNIKSPRVVYPLKPVPASNDRNWRGVRVSSKDSYLDALEHSQTSKDPREGVINSDVKPKISKLIRRDYNEGPVYRHPGDSYVASKEPSSTYSISHDANNRHGSTKNVAPRISYGGPTPEPFLPTPSDSYSLPAQSNLNFNHQDYNNHGSFYASPQVSYGSPTPTPPSQSYGLPSNSYNRVPSVPQNSYGPPPNNGYPAAITNQQAYGPPPSSSYGAPYAIQDYSQHIPSLMPSIDFSWPFALKLNAFTLAKILLKLVIFKMIVKFIALICLLLFIPKLEIIKKVEGNDDSDESDDSRSLINQNSTLERLNALTAFVTSSIEKYDDKGTTSSTLNDDDCTSFGCRARKFMSENESWNDYARLFKSYVAEENNGDNENQETRTNSLDSSRE